MLLDVLTGTTIVPVMEDRSSLIADLQTNEEDISDYNGFSMTLIKIDIGKGLVILGRC